MSSQHRKYWSEYALSGIEIKARPYDRKNFPTGPADMPPYFWNASHKAAPVTPRGYSEARSLIGSGALSDMKYLTSQSVAIITQIFSSTDGPEHSTCDADSVPQPCLVKLRLSSSLEAWKNTQRELGNILPAKKFGLTKASSEVLDILKATDWHEALLMKNTLFSYGILNMLIGAADATTLFSNYVTDIVEYYEHAYYTVFPTLETLLEKAFLDPYALQTIGGSERRSVIRISEEYLKCKVELEKRNKSSLTHSMARLGRRDAHILSFLDSSAIGFVTDAISWGYDAATAMSDSIFSASCHDVIDIGSDLLNSEVLNCFLSVSDITDTGIISEHALRRIYDAYAATGARVLTERWHEPSAKLSAITYVWEMVNDRHWFLRRAILGWPKARKTPAQPRHEADYDEVFDERYHTTGFWRPLKPEYQCNGGDTCDWVEDFLGRNQQEEQLKDLWWFLVLGPLEYVRAGRVDETQEEALVEGCCLQLARVFTRGLVQEMSWLIAHASHHAWQVNYLFEAAMFGSILDGGELIGKLDRYDSD